MSRGTLFQIAEEKKMLKFSRMDADDLICIPAVAQAAEWVEDIHFEDWCQDFKGLLGEYVEVLEVDREHKRIYFNISQRGKEMYFQHAFEKFKKTVSSLTIEDFADAYRSWMLHNEITGMYLDGALLNEVYHDFDDIVRRLKPDESYVVYAGSLMH